MSMPRWSALAAALIVGGVATGPASAQSLADRVAHAPAGPVQFEYAVRAGVCGDGMSYVHFAIGNGTSYSGSWSGEGAAPCVAGPARVVLARADGEIVGLRVYVGPPASSGGTDLGAVAAPEAARFLLDLAAKAQGAVARDALMPAMLADSTDSQSALVALVQDRTRSRETRSTAIGWLGRTASSATAAQHVLVQVATDESDNQLVRQRALRALTQLPGGMGIPALIAMAGNPDGGWVARNALTVVSSSGDPRALDFLRDVVRQAALPDQALATAVRSFGRQYATAADIAVIRKAWPRFTGERTQSAAISAVAGFGGRENAAWLLSLADDMSATTSIRRQALEAAARAGAGTADLSKLYDRTTDPQTKSAIISALGQIGDRAAIDKLLAIARGDESTTARRRAIAVLGRSGDPRVKQALESMVEHGGSR